MNSNKLHQSPLGQSVAYTTQYNPKLLFGLPRQQQRKQLNLPTQWHGEDIWHAYELSWIEPDKRPAVALSRFSIPHDSPSLIESKSLKLYLNSLNETVFQSKQELKNCIKNDLSQIAQAPVKVEIASVDAAPTFMPTHLKGEVIDQAPFKNRYATPKASLLKTLNSEVNDETLISHLLKSNCLITQQPDWASLLIRYSGAQIDRSALLEYIVSYRNHNEFHEHCVERIFCDVYHQCQPKKLFVQALYTRRGGLDINPWRSTERLTPTPQRTIRQ